MAKKNISIIITLIDKIYVDWEKFMKIEAGKAKPLIYVAVALLGLYFVFNMNKNARAQNDNRNRRNSNTTENRQNNNRQTQNTNTKNNSQTNNDAKKQGSESKQNVNNNKQTQSKQRTNNANQGSNTFSDRYSRAGTKGQDEIDKKSTSFGFMQVTFILLIIGLIAYFFYKYIARKKEGFKSSSDYINVLFTTALAANKHLQVVQIFDTVYILGVGDTSVNLITELKDRALVEQLKSEAGSNLPSLTFKEQIVKLFDRLKPGSNVKNDPEDEAISFFKEQRNKVNGIKHKNGNNDIDDEL